MSSSVIFCRVKLVLRSGVATKYLEGQSQDKTNVKLPENGRKAKALIADDDPRTRTLLGLWEGAKDTHSLLA